MEYVQRAKNTRSRTSAGRTEPLLPDLTPAQALQKNVRPRHTDRHSHDDLMEHVHAWLSRPKNHYLGFGGAGDALILLAACWQDPQRDVAFFCNDGCRPFTEGLFRLFHTPLFLRHNIIGSRRANEVYDLVTAHPSFRISGHLADGCDYDDWRRSQDKYAARMVTRADWVGHFGKTPNPFPTEKVLVIAPAGSDRVKHRQKYLEDWEFQFILDKNKHKTVYAVGSDQDQSRYPARHPYFRWLTLRPGEEREFIRTVNSADEVISTDTWLKTYSLIAGIETKIIRNRYDGQYRPPGDDPADWLFLNERFWPALKLVRVEELLA